MTDGSDGHSGERQLDGEIEPGDEILHGEPVEDGPQVPPAHGTRLEVASRFSGPLPRPDILAGYDEVLPGLAGQIVEAWRSETAQRHETVRELRATDREAMRSFYDNEKLGMILGFVGLLAVVGLAALAILLGESLVALGGVITAAAAAVWAIRRGSTSSQPPSPPVDLGDGDEIEKRPAPDPE